MYKKIIIVLVLILFSYNSLALSLNLSKTVYSKDDIFQGTIAIPEGTYLRDQKVTLRTGSNDKQLELQNLVNCNLLNCSTAQGVYTSSGATETSLFSSSLLAGLRIQEDSVITDASFDISNYDSNLPSQPLIDIGNDNQIEWQYPGYPTDNFVSIYLPQIDNFEETVITENCQKFTLPKSMKYKIKAYVKSTPSSSTLDIFIPNIEITHNGICTQPSANSWEEIECSIVLDSPLASGDYYFCLIGSNNILATNSTMESKNAYIGCSSNCNKVNKDYLMNFSAADFVTTLDHNENYNVSNKLKDSYGIPLTLIDSLNDYLESCPIQDGYCIIPINASSSNENRLRISNLNYRETTYLGEVLLQHSFLSSVEKQGTALQLILTNPVIIDLSKFNFKPVQGFGDQELEVSFLGASDKAQYKVIQGPSVRINASKTSAAVSESIQFDASESSSGNSTLIFFWDFGDGANSTLAKPVHSYSKAGTYVVSLKATDSNQISGTSLKVVSIGASNIQITDFSRALALLDNAEALYQSSVGDVKKIYQIFDFENKLKEAKTSLVSGSLSEAELSEILNTIPSRIAISDTYQISPYLTDSALNELLPSQKESFRETVKNVNEKISQDINAYLVSIEYLSNKKETTILVVKTINVPQDIQNVLVMDLLPLRLVPYSTSLELISPSSAEIIPYEASQNIKFNIQKLEKSKTNEIIYKIYSSEISEISKIKTAVIPENLNVALVPIDCGDGICNPAEDIISCPEDCRCGNDRCDLDETEETCPEDCKKFPIVFYISFIVVLGVIGGLIYVIYKNPELKEKLKLDKLFKSKKSLFSSQNELEKLTQYITNARNEGHVDKQISITLLKKGWTKPQVDYAIKKSNEKK